MSMGGTTYLFRGNASMDDFFAVQVQNHPSFIADRRRCMFWTAASSELTGGEPSSSYAARISLSPHQSHNIGWWWDISGISWDGGIQKR